MDFVAFWVATLREWQALVTGGLFLAVLTAIGLYFPMTRKYASVWAPIF